LEITIFERNDYIGGRTTTVNAWDAPSVPVEVGGSIFVQVNKILVDAVEAFNLSTTKFTDDGDEEDEEKSAPGLGIWNSREFVFKQSSGGGGWYYWDLAKLIWRYGLAPIRTNNLMKETVGKFLKMYEEDVDFENEESGKVPHFPFVSLTEKAYELGLTAVTAATGEQFLREHGIGDRFAQEIVQASTRVNYAQNLPLIHGLETMVCMATDGAVSVVGGNWKIFEGMVNAATNGNAKYKRLSTTVTSISKSEDGKKGRWILETDKSQKPQHFDDVIIATPFQFADLTLPGDITPPSKVPYVDLHVTLFTSPHRLSPSVFNLGPDDIVPNVILTTLPPDEHPGTDPNGCGSPGFFSISVLQRVRNPGSQPAGRKEYLYKIFSPMEVNNTYLSYLLGVENQGNTESVLSKDDVSWIHRKLWQSYPYEYPRVTFDESSLDDGLWYTGGMENFISTMETNALMGKNIARLIADEWLQGKSNAKGENKSGSVADGKGRDMDQKILTAAEEL
jgi:prenylcysteine oxidase / farnesylcysteine lyase